MAEAALADARLAHDADHLRLTCPRACESLLEGLDLLRASHEPRETARSRYVEPPACGADPLQLVHVQRVAGALHLELAEVIEYEVALHDRGRAAGQIRLAGLRELLHPLSQAHRVPHCGVVHPEVLADRTHHQL